MIRHERFSRWQRPIIIGDSNSVLVDSWPDYSVAPREYFVEAQSGRTMNNVVNLGQGWINNHPTADGVVFWCGVNDAASGTLLATLQSRMTSCFELIMTTNSLPMIVIGMHPCEEYVNWTPTEYTAYLAFRDWLETECESRGVYHIKIYDVLEDGSNADNMPAAYRQFGVDPLHTAGEGSARIGRAVDAAINAQRRVPGLPAWDRVA